jgi:hypothetical protein
MNALSTVRSCRAAREIQQPHGEYVGRGATVLPRYEPPGTSRVVTLVLEGVGEEMPAVR